MSKDLNGKKKMTDKVGYKKWTECTSKEEVKSIIDSSNAVYMIDQSVYNDQSQSMTIQIHFKP